jgi:hypothetical protein
MLRTVQFAVGKSGNPDEVTSIARRTCNFQMVAG